MAEFREVREVSGTLVRHALELVRHRAGEDGVARLLDLAGEARPREMLEDTSIWSSHESVCALFEAACEVTGDPRLFLEHEISDAGRITPSTAEFVALMESVGSAAGIYQHVAAATAKLAVTVEAEVTSIGDEEACISYTPVRGHRRIKPVCDYTAMMLANAPVLFGFPLASVVEEECVAEGSDRCVYRIGWSESATDDADLERRTRYLEAKVQMLAARFEALKSTAADLVRSDDVDQTLARIARNARQAARAPKHLLAVRLHPDDELRVLHHGMTADEAAAMIDALPVSEAEAEEVSTTRLTVPVCSARTHYGWMVAAYQDGANLFFPGERALLASYAGMAAAALDTATALRDARREADTANALLALASSLAEVGTRRDLAQRLVEAVPAVVGSNLACVMLWDEAEAVMTLEGLIGLDDDIAASFRGLRVRPDDTPAITEIVDRRVPIILDEQTADDFVRGLLNVAGAPAAAVVPIASGERVYGLVAAAINRDAAPTGAAFDMMARLRGLASHGSTAFANAGMLERIQHDATHDALTGLPNQRLLADRADQLLRQRRNGAAALVFLDLDRFKIVNDTLGHECGDRLLRAVGSRLGEALRQEDTLARLGGDEFAILLPRVGSAAEATAVVDRVLATLQTPFSIEGHTIFVGASAGIVIAREHGDTYEVLLKHADAAMYQAKAAGRGGSAVYECSSKIKPYTALSLEADLHMALGRDELRVLYQPQVDLETGDLIGAEALVRWAHPTLGLLTPDRFLPIAEESGLIVAIDDWVVRTACVQAAEWRSDAQGSFRVAVNLSGRDLEDPTLPARVERALDAAGLPPAYLELEVTEGASWTSDLPLQNLDRLHALGVRLAIDDFGLGNSLFSRLAQTRVHTLKLDRSYIQRMTDAAGETIVNALTLMAHTLGLEVVAEGVETDDQRMTLRSIGCEIGQGYFFARPTDAASLTDALARRRRDLLASTPR